MAPRTRSLRPARIPIGTPTRSESTTAASIRASVCMLSSHSPMRANETNAANTVSAGRQPPKRNTTITPAAITPTQVSQSSTSSIAVTSHSASARKPSRIAKKTFGPSAVRWSRSQVWNSSRRSGSSLHVSDSGQGSSSRQSPKPSSITATIAATCTGRPRQRAAGRGSAGVRTRLASDRHPEPRTWRPGSLRGPRSRPPCGRSPPHAPACRRRPPRHGVSHDGRHVELRPVLVLARPRLAHDPAQRQHVRARDVADEVRDVLVRGRAHELLGRAELHDRAVAHDRDPVPEPERLGEVVGDEQHRLAGLELQAADLVLHVAPDQRIQCAEGLVVEHQLRVDGERARQPHPLLHAARELVGEVVRGVLEPDQPQHLLGAREALRLRHALDLESERDVVEHPAVREQAEVLEHHRDRVPAQLAQLGRRRRPSRPGRRSRSCRRSARSGGSASARASTCPSPTGP